MFPLCSLLALGAGRSKSIKRKDVIYLKLVKFIQPYSPYAVDDVTGLSDKLAEKLLAEEICVPYKEEKGASKKSEEVEEPKEEKSVEEPKVNKMVEGAPVQK